ncbi:Fungal Zn2-Cys6 binuclear cluster domain-containing protein [Cladophialophora immunda]|nr:Fungal Zn2-Cys6 binuclear cluster domain-containing protein [Cladophialophora immunda]
MSDRRLSSTSRSRTGCSSCLSASRKCDETKPTCQRCTRLGFRCNYERPLRWKNAVLTGNVPSNVIISDRHEGGSPQWPREKSPARSNHGRDHNPPSVILQSIDDNQLIERFLTSGHLQFHWSNMWDNQFVKTYGSLCFTYPPVREAIVAFELLEQFGSSPVALARVSSALSIFQSRLRGSIETNNDILLAAGFLMCHVAMKAGYTWTGHLKSLLSIALAGQEPQPNIDRLAGLDMDIWLIGRCSGSLHVWSTMCSGRSGSIPTRIYRAPSWIYSPRQTQAQTCSSDWRHGSRTPQWHQQHCHHAHSRSGMRTDWRLNCGLPSRTCIPLSFKTPRTRAFSISCGRLWRAIGCVAGELRRRMNVRSFGPSWSPRA